MANNSNVFLVAQKEMELSDPTQEDLFAYGVVAEVKQVLRVSDDLVKVLVEGKYRAKLTDLDTTGDFLLASVRPAPVRVGKTEDAVETEALLRALKSSFDEYLGMNPRLAKDVVFTIVSSTDPEFLSEYMPANLLFRYEDKQAVMNENTPRGPSAASCGDAAPRVPGDEDREGDRGQGQRVHGQEPARLLPARAAARHQR